tara:strand:+ start:143 stop:433 length:291 start_codon:yes stop_codon:yes gene_type:complete
MRGNYGTKYEGVTWHEEDRECGPFMVRIGGTSEFVSSIDPFDKRSWHRGKVVIVEGWDNPLAKKYSSMKEAKDAGASVWEIEGFHTSIEATNWNKP